jgi:uncharacterized protein (DUF2236 family)
MDCLFDDTSMVRRVHREQAVALGGPRALLMMGAHPVAFEGFFNATGSLTDPYARLERTSAVLDALTWGPRERAERLTRRVRLMHRAVRGELAEAAGPFPAGTPYAADDPALLLWVLGCLVDSCALAFERYVGALSATEKERYWGDYKIIADHFGLDETDMPATWGHFQAYMADRLASPELVVTPKARELGIDIILRPAVPLALRPLREVLNQVTIGLLPDRVRRQYGFRWDPVRRLAARGGAEYVKRVVVPLLPARVRFVAGARHTGPNPGLPAAA